MSHQSKTTPKAKRAQVIRDVQAESQRRPDPLLDRAADPGVTVARPSLARALSSGPGVRRIHGKGL